MIASEGFWFVIVPMLLFMGSAFLGIWRKKAWLFVPAGLFLLIWMSMLYFFRDPARPKPPESAIVSVSDGVVDGITELENGRTRIEVYLSLLNVHALRSPATGTVTNVEVVPGRFLPAHTEQSIEENQRITVEMETPHGPLEFSAISGVLARRIVMPLHPGEQLLAGQRIGFVRFGSRSQLILPPGVDATVDVGDDVYGGVTVVALPMIDEDDTVPDSLLENAQ